MSVKTRINLNLSERILYAREGNELMSNLFDWFRQEASRQASKAAADALWAQGNGTDAYSLAGKIFVGCGVGWFLLSLIPIVCKNPMSDYLWMLILAAIQIILGLILVILSKKSPKFQEWADKDFEKDLNKVKKFEEKVTVGKMTLPMTHGDVFAFKFLGISIAILIIVIAVIASL